LQEHFMHLPPGAADPFASVPATKALSGLKRPCNAFRKPPSRLAIYKQQEFYEPTTDGCLGTRADDSDPLDRYRTELNRLDVVVAGDPEDDNAPWE